MKPTPEIPESVFRRAQARAAEQGILLRQFVGEVVEYHGIAVPGSGSRAFGDRYGLARARASGM